MHQGDEEETKVQLIQREVALGGRAVLALEYCSSELEAIRKEAEVELARHFFGGQPSESYVKGVATLAVIDHLRERLNAKVRNGRRADGTEEIS